MTSDYLQQQMNNKFNKLEKSHNIFGKREYHLTLLLYANLLYRCVLATETLTILNVKVY